MEWSTTPHRSLIGRATYRKCFLCFLANRLDSGSPRILVRTNRRNVPCNLHPLHRLGCRRIRNNPTLGFVHRILDSVRCHIISCVRGTKALVGVFRYRKYQRTHYHEGCFQGFLWRVHGWTILLIVV